MPETRYARFLPLVLNWIRDTLHACTLRQRSVASFGFERLPMYFRRSLLHTTRVVVTDAPPFPPLAAWGLSEFASIGNQPRAVTYLDTYFLEASAAGSEPIHFHELVHAVQWRVLGPEDFLLLYAAGLAAHGYQNSPLEAMAYAHQAGFEAGRTPYSVEAEVGAQTLALLPGTTATPPGNLEFTDSGSGETVTLDKVCEGVRPGWHQMLRDLLWRMTEAGWDGRVIEVKEKMGCLWVYIEQNRDDLEQMITLAGERSTFICEVCGAMPPRSIDGSATMWRCEECASG